MKNRIIAFIMSSVLLITAFAFVPEDNGLIKAETASAAGGASIAELQARFPQGMHWNHIAYDYNSLGDVLMYKGGDNEYSNNISDQRCYTHAGSPPYGQYDCNAFDGGIQCCGFARKLAYEVYGTYASGWPHGSYDSLKAGDVVHYYGGNASSEYGHWVFITGIDGNAVTVAECNSESNPCVISWGNVIPISYLSFAEIFSAPYELPSGDPLPDPAAVNEGVYTIRNVGTGLMMNYGYGSTDKAFFSSFPDGTPEQKFRIVSEGGNKYKVEIQHGDGGILNFSVDDGTAVGAGIKVNRWGTYTGDSTQQVYFRKAADNQYVITSAKGNGVIGVASADKEQRLYTQNYQAGNKNQLWVLVAETPEPEPEPDPVTTAPVIFPAEITTETTVTVPATQRLLHGIDVSGFQRTIDWDAVKESGLDFAIIRSGTTLNSDTETYYWDTRFDENYEGAVKAGMNIGLYYYCGACTEEGFRQCAYDFLEHIDGRKIQYPVYIDVEASQGQMDMGKAQLTSYILSALEIIRDGGYRAGVYANKNWFTNYVDADRIRNSGFEIWWAQWEYSTENDKSSVCGIWQYSNQGSVSGIPTDVDLDVAYIDYAASVIPSAGPGLPGDIDGSGSTDIADIVLLQKYLANKASVESFINADLNGGGKINVFDLIILKRMLIN